MRAIVYDAPGATPRLRSVPAPDCPDDGVVLDVAATGVCRSDWHAWRGHDTVPLPHIGGHEFAGVVAAVGPRVRSFAVGDRVTSPFVNGCGRCEWCRTGRAQVCPDQTQPGFTHAGSFAEQVAVRAADHNLVRLPDEIDMVSAASLGCRFATAFRALTGHGPLGAWPGPAPRGAGPDIPGSTPTHAGPGVTGAAPTGAELGRPGAAPTDAGPGIPGAAPTGDGAPTTDDRGAGEWVAVFGCGGVGLSAIMIAKALGARVVAVDPSPAARAAATELGAVTVAGASDIADITGGGAHLSIDAFGSAATADAAVRSLRRGGRHVQVGLMLGADAAAAMPWDLVVARELHVVGSHGMAAADYPPMLGMMAGGRLRPGDLVGAVVGLEDIPAALTAMDHPIPPTAGLTVAVTSILD